MDIDALADEVLRRLVSRIQEGQAADAAPKPRDETPDDSSCSDSKTKKLLVTQEKAAGFAPGSKATFPQGTIITPLAYDTFMEHNVCVEFE